MTKQQNDLCTQQRLRTALASTQSDQFSLQHTVKTDQTMNAHDVPSQLGVQVIVFLFSIALPVNSNFIKSCREKKRNVLFSRKQCGYLQCLFEIWL